MTPAEAAVKAREEAERLTRVFFGVQLGTERIKLTRSELEAIIAVAYELGVRTGSIS